MTSLRIALRLAFSSDLRQRWRQVSVIVSSGLATVMILLGAGFVGAASVSDAGSAARSPVWASEEDEPALLVRLRGAVLPSGYQVPVVWLEPAAGHESDPTVVPPGLTRMPEPGTAVLSPGIVSSGLKASDFGLEPSAAGSGDGGAIGIEGLSTWNEGFVYARPAPGRTIGDSDDGVLLELRGYGPGPERASLETQLLILSSRAMAVGVAWLVILPSLIVLVGGARAMSQVREDRARILWRLGVSTRRIRGLLAFETAALSGVGVAVGLSLWPWVDNLRSIPLTGAVLLPGALHLDAGLIVAAAVAVVAVSSVSAIIGPRQFAQRRRPLAVRWWHVVPFLLAVAMIAGSRLWVWGPTAERALFGGLILAMASLPLAIPVVARAVGRRMASSPSPPVWLAGRRLEFRPAALSRPAAAVGVLVLTAGGAFAIYARMVQPDVDIARSPVTAFSISWSDGRDGDLDLLRETLPEASVTPIVEEEFDPESEEPPTIYTLFDDCGSWAEAMAPFSVPACTASGVMSDESRTIFSDITGVQPVFTSPTDIEPTAHTALIIADEGTTQLDIMARTATAFPAVNISGAGPRNVPLIAPGWIVLGWIVATLLLSVALLREVGDRALSALSHDAPSRRLGLSESEIARTHRWALLGPVFVAVGAGYAGAIAFAVYGFYLGWTVASLAQITAVAIIVAALAVISLSIVFSLNRRILTDQI